MNIIFLLPIDHKDFRKLQNFADLCLPTLVLLHGVKKCDIEFKIPRDWYLFELSKGDYPNLASILNFGLQEAETLGFDFVRRLDSFDALKIEQFNRNLDYIRGSDKDLFVFGKYKHTVYPNIFFDNCFIHSTLFIRLARGIYYNNNYSRAQDFELYIRYLDSIYCLHELDINKGFKKDGASKKARVVQLRNSCRIIVESSLNPVLKIPMVVARFLKLIFHYANQIGSSGYK